MLSGKTIAVLLFFTFTILTISGCVGNKTDESKYDKPIKEPVIAVVGGADVILGDLLTHGVSIHMPGSAIDEQTTATLSHPNDEIEIDPALFSPLGAPIEIKLGGDLKRFNEAARISIKFDSEGIQESGQVYAAYYHPLYGWELYRPDEVDLAGGVLIFSTYHFSWWAPVQLDDEQRMKNYIERRSVEQFVQNTAGDEAAQQVEEMVRAIMQEGMGIQDNQIISIITRAVVEEIPGGKIGLAIYDADLDAFIGATLEETTKKLGVLLTDEQTGYGWNEGMFTDAAGNPGAVGSLAQAAGYFYEGNSEEALRVLASAIADELPVIKNIKKIGDVAVQITEHTIELWKNQEIEKAYRVYRDGAQGGWLSYSVDPGDWDQLVAQSRGAFRQVQIDFVKSWCDARGINPNELSAERHREIADLGLEHLRRQFEQRRAREADIEGLRANNIAVMELLKEKGLLERSFSNPMYSGREGEDLEMLMTRLFGMIEKVKRETGRSAIVDITDFDVADPHERSNLIPRQILADLIWTYYYDGDDEYQQKLVELGFYPDPQAIISDETPEESETPERPSTGTCYWHNTESVPPSGTTSNPKMEIDAGHTNSVKTTLTHGVSGCPDQFFHTNHRWTFFDKMWAGEPYKMEVVFDWQNRGTADCSALVAGGVTTLTVGDFKLRAENMSINIKTDPQGIVTDSATWIAPEGEAGDKFTITVHSSTGSYGSNARFHFEYVCD